MTPTTQANMPTKAPAPITLAVSPITTTPDSSSNQAGSSGNIAYQITLHVTLEPEDWIYHDYITLSCDSAHISLSPWQATQEPVAKYINSFKETKRVYTGSFSITCVATISDQKAHSLGQVIDANLGNLHLTYYKKSDKKITHHLIPLILSDQEVAGERTALNSSRAVSGISLVQAGEASQLPCPALCKADTKTGNTENSLTPNTQPEHDTQEHDSCAQEDGAQKTAHSTHIIHEAHALISHTVHLAASQASHYTTQYRAEVHSLVIITLIIIFSLLKQKRRIACAAQNIALFILLWCYYAMADREIPSYYYWLLTAILMLCVGILSIKRAEDISAALFSKHVYRYFYYFAIIAGMMMVASSLILCAKATQAYYIISAVF
jgi:hypothetical protein